MNPSIISWLVGFHFFPFGNDIGTGVKRCPNFRRRCKSEFARKQKPILKFKCKTTIYYLYKVY